jgi:DNA-binding MarR family transcriptional regulator
VRSVDDEIKIRLSRGQIKHVLREATEEEGIAGVLSRGVKDRAQLMDAYRISSSPQFSQSLLLGLIVLACFPRDGGTLGVNEVAALIELSPSTAHRYLRTLVMAGLLDQEPQSRQYRLTRTR